ncbi:MAG: relaxase domain-containing protein [Acidobacteriaceae bacterium]|nr:relaxase domain-containing protein [Acidobacteriaceae bacterium]
MLSLSSALNAEQVKNYHKEEFAAETSRYYSQGNQSLGQWQGQLAAEMGLSGAVTEGDFALLADGINPATGEQMVRHVGAKEYTNANGKDVKSSEHSAGWDATFSAPKSVSLTALVGGDERLMDAHRTAVNTALAELERYAQARIGGNNPAVTTGRFVAATFEHDTARPVDGYAAPQLHTHCVIFNVTQMEDGSTRAIHPRAFFYTKSYATAVYQSELMREVRRLGYEIEPGKSGAPEIKGYSREYLEASSPRRQQIEERLEAQGLTGNARAAELIALETRDKKLHLSKEEVFASHKEMAARFGNQSEKVVAEAKSRGEQIQLQGATTARVAVAYARDSSFERESVNDERTLMRDALRRGMGEASFQQVRSEFEQQRQQGRFIEVQGTKYASGRSFTTPEAIATEKAVVAYVLKGQGAAEPIMSPVQAKAQAETRDFLNERQRTVIQEVLTSTDRVHGLQGLAGTGKTTILESIREGAERHGYAVEGFAPTSKAAGALRDAGISANTMQSFLTRGGGEKFAGDRHHRTLYMLDESSLASAKQMKQFLDKIKSQDRVLVIGDTRQHQGVDAGRPFEQMQQAGMRTSQLDTIVRQRANPELQKAVEHLAANRTRVGISMLREQGRITEIEDASSRIRAIAKDYAASPEKTLVVSPDNRSRQQINEAIRKDLQANGTLARDGQSYATLVQRSDMTREDRQWAARYEAGNTLYYSRGSEQLGIKGKSYAVVQSVDAANNTVTVQRADGQSITYDPRRLCGVTAFREVEREIATGDRIQFTAPDKRLGVANRDLGTVTKIEPNAITVRMDGDRERTVRFDPAKTRTFDHGYAVTSHSSQGLTFNRVLVNLDTDSSRELINTRLAYVSISRASHEVTIYTNNAETLGERLQTDVTKTTAMDIARARDERIQHEISATQSPKPPVEKSQSTQQEATIQPVQKGKSIATAIEESTGYDFGM